MTKYMRIITFFLLFAIMLIFGTIENIKGVTYPLIKTEFNASWEQQGLLVSMLSLSYVGFCVVAGIFLGRFGIKPSILCGFAALSIGLLSANFISSFFTAGAALFVMFAGFGFFEIGVNALASKVFIRKPAMLMNILHAFYGIGGFIGPIIAGLLTNRAGLNWRMLYVLALPVSLFLLIPSIFVKFPESREEGGAQEAAKRKTFFNALENPKVWLLAIILGLGVTIEMSSPNWGAMYFQDIYGLDPRTSGAAFISAFFICFTVSRLVCGLLVERVGYMRFLTATTVVVLVIFTVGFLMGARGIFLLPVLGFFIGPLWPTIMAIAITHFKKDAPVFCSAMIAVGTVFYAGIQYLVGLTNRFFGAAWGYRSALLYTLILLTMLVILGKKLKIEKESKNEINDSGT